MGYMTNNCLQCVIFVKSIVLADDNYALRHAPDMIFAYVLVDYWIFKFGCCELN